MRIDILFFEEGENSVYIFVGEGVVHREAEHGVGDAVGVGEVLAGGGGEGTVGAELADEGVEVAASEDVRLAHREIELVAGFAEFLCVDENREVAVVVTHSGHVVEEGDALDVAQCLAVAVGDFLTGGDGCIDLAEVEKAVCRAHLVHLGVDAGSHDLGFASESEVLEIIYAFLGLLVMHHHGASLDCVVDLGGMEGERGHVAGVED